jgi:UDP-2,3-diacylglucosamine pyrophosphatase LpxH
MKKKIWWNDECNAILRRLLKMVKTGTKIIYLPGNHDEAIRNFIPFVLGEHVEFVDALVHTTSSGERYAVLHGDQYDAVVGNMKWLALLGSTIYDWLLMSNTALHWIRTKLGYHTYWSLAGYLKSKAKKAVSFVQDFESALILHAAKHDCTGVICGHIHQARNYVKDGIRYVNCGDWIESLTAVVELDNGQLELIHWHDMKHEGFDDHNPNLESSINVSGTV